MPSALIWGSETLRMASQRGALTPICEATIPSTASPISETSPSPRSLKWLSDVSKPKKSVVTTEELRAFGPTRKIFGRRVFSFGSCAAFALNRDRAFANFVVLAAELAKSDSANGLFLYFAVQSKRRTVLTIH